MAAAVAAVMAGWGGPSGVTVYVKVFTNSPFLVCMDLARSHEELIDPKYSWVGPDGKSLKGQKYVNLTETGKLMVMGFKESMSGAYTCTLSHKVIETTTQEEREISEAYHFMVYAYREADHAYRVLVRFTTRECKLTANDLFFEELKKILNNIISDLRCHIVEPSCKCHSVRLPDQGLRHELFVRFQVSPFAPGWKEVCHQVPYDCEDATNMRVREVLCQPPSCLLHVFSTNFCLSIYRFGLARDRIGEFFHKQTYALKHQLRIIPTIHYVDSSFSVIRIDSCQPGFGKNDITHRNCASCCVVCSPGTYSPNNEVTCQICPKSQVKVYGATSC